MSSSISKDAKRFFLNFAIAGVSATVAKSITAPIDRIKLILQNQHSALHVLTGERKPYKGILDCIIRIPKEQGFFSFWRGNWINILRYFPAQAINFSFFGAYSKFLHSIITPDSELKSALILFLAGGMAGACSSTFTYPIDSCQTRVAVDIGGSRGQAEQVKREFSGLGDCIRKVVGTDGIVGMYRGFSVGGLGVSIYRALYFGLFDVVTKRWTKFYAPNEANTYRPPIIVRFSLAQASSMCSGLLIYPLDTISRRMMLDSGRPKELRLFTSPLHVTRVLYAKEGLRAFYRGATMNCMRGISGALVLVFYDEIIHRIDLNKWIN